ncbi:MAG TPA: helicase, partial [Nocardioides sp.]|nr:helicase [Nocardioides sp.]
MKLHDPVHNPGHGAGRHSMHNHFIIKSLALTRPGGLVAVLTSHYTMDSQNPGARRAMAEMADLLGAVRLPNGAFQRAAGTTVLTDLLLFRRRLPGDPVRAPEWENVVPVQIDGPGGRAEIRINTYFDTCPDHMLGEVSTGTGTYGVPMLRVTGNLDGLEDDLAQVLDEITFTARRNDLTMTAPEPAAGVKGPGHPVTGVVAAENLWTGSLVAQPDGTFATVADGLLEPVKVPKKAASEMRALLELRDRASHLLTLEGASAEDTEEITAARATLSRDYRKYVGRWGPINRFTLRRTGRMDENGEDTYARIVPPAIRLLRTDPFGALVLALEQFDDVEQVATPAAIMSRRVVAPRPEVQGVDTPADAIAVSLDKTGGVDLPMIADLLGLDEEDAREALAGLVFTEPDTKTLVHAPAYLSGDVRTKLDQARLAAKEEPEFEVNVQALEAVMPPTLGADEIAAKLGAVWISAEVHQAFLNELLRVEDVRVENPLPGMWEVRGGRGGLLSTSEWGTVRRPAPDIAQAVMEQRAVLVHDEFEDIDGRKRRVLNPVETTAAQEKADALSERFAEWVWEEPERARGLVEEYNRRFNSIVLRDYTDAGNYLTLPGVAEGFTPRQHQRAAVARMIAEPSAGLFHEVGAGKTAEMIIGVSEMRRMGLVNKPVIVVPNHMLEQFSREWLQIYPQARVLAASSSDVSAEKRREFVAKAA